MKTTVWLLLLLTVSCAAIGCGPSRGSNGGPPPQAPEVLVSLPIAKQVTDYEDFPGRIDAVNSIEVRARVTGYLEKAHFKEGAEVKEGDVLFEIDARPYQAELQRAEGNVVQSEGRLQRLDADYERARKLVSTRAMNQEDFDKIAGDRIEATGAVTTAKANRNLAALNLGYTKVKASLTGRVSRRFIDPGNMVKADDTTLTTIVSLNPIYAYFDVDERSTLRLQKLTRSGKIKWSSDSSMPVLLGMADEDGFSKQGTINFADNRVDADTGTWRLRGLFKNDDLSLTPGLFVRIRLPIGEAYQATLVAEQALSTDQGQKFVYVVGKDNKVDYRRVKVGRTHEFVAKINEKGEVAELVPLKGNRPNAESSAKSKVVVLRVITDGLTPNEKMVVSGLQRVRPGVEVSGKVVPMANIPTGDAAAPKEKSPSASNGK